MRDITAETFDAVLFDNDGTLSDSTAAVERAWRDWAAHHGVPVERLVSYHGVPSRSIVEAVVEAHVDVDLATADIDRRELEDVLAAAGASEAAVGCFSKAFDETFGADTEVSLQNIVDTKHYLVNTPDAVIKIAPEKSDCLEIRTIGGQNYLLIPVDGDVEVNGIRLSC